MGTRNYYVIANASKYDGDDLSLNVCYITQNLKDAKDRFQYLYDESIREYTNDDDEVWAEHDFDVQTNAKTGKVTGYFDFYEDGNGMCRYILTTIHTQCFSSYWLDTIDNSVWEEDYKRNQEK